MVMQKFWEIIEVYYGIVQVVNVGRSPCLKPQLIRPVARKAYGSIAHEAKPNGLFASWAIDPWSLRAKGLIVLVSPN